MKMPKKLKVNKQVYKIKIKHKIKDKDGTRYWGRAIHSQRKIFVEGANCQDQKQQTLMHEIIHIIGLQSGHNLKEGQIDALAYGLINVIRSNEWFKDYFCGKYD